MNLAPEFAQVLRANRDYCNQRVKEVRHYTAHFDPDDFTECLQQLVNPLVAAVAAVDNSKTSPAALTGFDIVLELVSKKLLGRSARSSYLAQAWQDCAPCYIPLIAQQPVELLGALSNALINVEAVVGARATQWLAQMQTLAPLVGNLDEFRAVGDICAWRSGLAHARDSALTAANQLPAALALASVGASATAHWPEIYTQLRKDRWWSADNALNRHHWVVGGYRGFDGAFGSRPDVAVSTAGIFIADKLPEGKSADAQYFLLQGDCYGALLLPATANEFAAAKSASQPNPALTAQYSARAETFGFPAGSLQLLHNQHSLVLFSAFSYQVHLLPLPSVDGNRNEQ